MKHQSKLQQGCQILFLGEKNTGPSTDGIPGTPLLLLLKLLL